MKSGQRSFREACRSSPAARAEDDTRGALLRRHPGALYHRAAALAGAALAAIDHTQTVVFLHVFATSAFGNIFRAICLITVTPHSASHRARHAVTRPVD